MQAMNLSKKKFGSLEKFFVPNEVTNTEGQLFIVHDHQKWEDKRYLLKRLYLDEGDTFGNKLLTVNTLIDNREDIGIPELVYPEKLAIVHNKVIGFTMPLIENSVNLSCLLNSFNVPREEKINLLRQVGEILKKVHNVEKYKNNFFLGDVHEGNFIVEANTRRVRAIDLDSCKIGNNQPFPAKYLAPNLGIDSLFKKYTRNDNGLVIPTVETDLFCYNLMILNTISHTNVQRMSLEEFYTYLQYLRDIGFSEALVDCFMRLYINCKNDSPLEILDSIPKDMHFAHYNIFKAKTKRR